MKQIITKKDKLMLAKLDPNAEYIMLVNLAHVSVEALTRLQANVKIQYLPVRDINQAIKFVEIPKNDRKHK